jgi:hypothetical protein
MDVVNRIKLAKIIRYLKEQELWHDSYDLKEEPIESILADYGIVVELNDEEKEIIKDEFLKMVERVEIAEAVVWAMKQERFPPQIHHKKPVSFTILPLPYVMRIDSTGE